MLTAGGAGVLIRTSLPVCLVTEPASRRMAVNRGRVPGVWSASWGDGHQRHCRVGVLQGAEMAAMSGFDLAATPAHEAIDGDSGRWGGR